jgi:hypothetical protein
MSADFDREKVLARVKKMMTLANDAGASEGERENALRMAHATLAKYNLTMSEAEASGKKAEEARGAEHMTGRDYPWMRTTAHAVAKLFFCEYFYILIGGGKVKHFFVGRESNVFTAQGMTTYVIDSIDREAQRTAKARTGNCRRHILEELLQGRRVRCVRAVRLDPRGSRGGIGPGCATGAPHVAEVYRHRSRARVGVRSGEEGE